MRHLRLALCVFVSVLFLGSLTATAEEMDDQFDVLKALGIDSIEHEIEGSEEIPENADIEPDIGTRAIHGFLIVRNVGNRTCLISRGRRGYNYLGFVRPRRTMVFPLWTQKARTILWAHRGRNRGAPTRVIAKHLTPPREYFTYRWTIRCI